MSKIELGTAVRSGQYLANRIIDFGPMLEAIILETILSSISETNLETAILEPTYNQHFWPIA